MEVEKYFKDTVYAFLNWLLYHFPHDSHVQHSKTLLDHAVSVTGIKLVMLQYINYVFPYQDEIQARNTEFFIHLANENTLGELDLSSKWKKLNLSQQNEMWKYIQQMTDLALLLINE
jgi:hypothetical protein